MAARDIALSLLIKAKDFASSVVRKFRGEVKDAATDADSLDTSLKTTSKSTEKAAQSVDEMAKRVAAAGNKVEETAKEVDEASKKLEEQARAADKAAQSIGKMAQRYNGAGKPIDSTRKKIKDTNDKLEAQVGAATRAGSGIGSMTKRVVALGVAYLGIDRLFRKLLDVLSTGDKFESLGIQMEQAMGSFEKGQLATEWVKEFTRNTELQLNQSTEVFVRLKNFGIDPLTGAMQAIVDQSAKLGGGYERVEGISLALGQAWAKQKLQGEEILQLIERGVPVWELLATVTGKNTRELQEMSSAGALGRDVIKQLIDEMGRQSAGAAAQNMSRLSGLVSNAKDQWQLFLGQIADSGALEYAKNQLQDLLDEVERLRESGELDDIARRISDAMIGMAEAVKGGAAAIRDNIGVIKLLGAAWVGLKMRSWAGEVVGLASAFRNNLSTAVAGSVVQFKVLRGILRTTLWLAVADSVFNLAQNLLGLARAKEQVNQAARDLAGTQGLAAEKINQFNEAAGTNYTTLAQINEAVKAGTLVWSEHAGGYRLAADAAKLAAEAEKEAASADALAADRKAALNTATKALLETYAEGKGKGEELSKIIADIGDSARNQGKQGVEAMSIALQDLVVHGKETAEGLKAGLVDYLEGLSDDQFDRFGDSIIEAMGNIDESAKGAGVRLSFLKNVLDAQLTAAARRAGVDIGETLTGVDETTRKAVGNLQRLVETMKAAGKTGDDADKLFRAGLLETLKSLDTSKEVDAVTNSLRALRAEGQITDKQLADGITEVKKRWQEVQKQSRDTADQTKKDQQDIRDSVGETADQQQELTEKTEDSTGAAAGLAEAYRSIRAPVDALGPAASAAFNALQGIDGASLSEIRGEFSDLEKQISDSNAELDRIKTIVNAGFTGITAFLRKASKDAAEVKKQYAEQKLAVEKLRKAYDEGAISAADFARAAGAAASNTSLLNNADLSALRNEIRQAEDQMRSLQDSTAGTLNGLQRELAQLRGDTLKAEKLNYQSRVADLEEKLAEAQRSGDAQAISNASQALSIASQIYRQKKQQIADEAKAQQAREDDRKAEELGQAAQQSANTTNAVQGAASQPAQKEMVIHLTAGSQAAMVKSEDPEALLAVLNNAGMRTA